MTLLLTFVLALALSSAPAWGGMCAPLLEPHSPAAQRREAIQRAFNEDHGYQPNLTLTAVKALGFPLDELTYTALNIPEAARPYYDAEGRFHYRPTHGLRLSPEDGSAPLSAVRIHLDRDGILLRDWLNALKHLPTTNLWAVTPSTDGPARESALREGYRIVTGSVGSVGGLALWAQDDSKPLSGTGTPTLLIPRRYIEAYKWDNVRPNSMMQFQYAAAVNLLRDAGLVRTILSPLAFDGGNLVVSSRHVFAGAAVITENCEDLAASREDVLAALEAEFGLPVVEVGSANNMGWRRVPIDYHVDLTMAIARDPKGGQDIAFLNDHDLGDAVSRRAFLGSDIKDIKHLLRAGGPFMPYAGTRRAQLHELEAQLKALGYQVLRLPGYDSKPSGSAELRHISYVNTIFSGTAALVPSFELGAMDEYAYAVYRNAGFTVVPMCSAAKLSYFGGGSRCASSVFRGQLSP